MAPSHPPPPNIQAIPPPHPAHIPELQNIICDPTFPKSSPYHSTRRRPAECHPIPFQFFPTLDVRHAVFIKEQQCSSTAEVDDDDARSMHWVAFTQEDKKRKEVPAATIRLVPWNPEEHAHSEEPYVKIERLATLSPFRGRSYARLLVDAAVEYAQQHPGQCTKPFPAPTINTIWVASQPLSIVKGAKSRGSPQLRR